MSEKFSLEFANEAGLDIIETIYNEAIDSLRVRKIHQWRRGVYPTRQTAVDAFNKNCLYLCRMGDEVVGTVILNGLQSSEYDTIKWKWGGKFLVIHTLVIRPAFCGKGAGRFIMRYAENFALSNGYESMRLDVFPGNAVAVGLYQSFGFTYSGKIYFEQKEPTFEWYDCYEKLLRRPERID